MMSCIRCLAALFLKVSLTTALQWTSAGILTNGSVVPACPGQDLTLAWNYTTDTEEHLHNTEWRYNTPGARETQLLATQTMGVFVGAPGFNQRMQFVPNAGIRLQNIATGDSGTYSVHVFMESHGTMVEHRQTVDVHVSDQSVTTDNLLHVEMLDGTVHDNSTDEFHIQLACGQFLPVWHSRANVVWTMPSGQSRRNTSFTDGKFIPTLPNPVDSGEYTCVIDHNSPASSCVRTGTSLHRGDTLSVNGGEAQLKVKDAQISFLQEELTKVQQKYEDVKQHLENVSLNSFLETPQNYVAILCMDESDDCAALGPSVCDKSPSWSRKYCRKSCDLCHEPPTEPVCCFDQDPMENCIDKNKDGCAGIYASWARAHCQAYCGYCEPCPVTPCVDKNTMCADYSDEVCVGQYRLWAYRNCMKRCGLCTNYGFYWELNSNSTRPTACKNSVDFNGVTQKVYVLPNTGKQGNP